MDNLKRQYTEDSGDFEIDESLIPESLIVRDDDELYQKLLESEEDIRCGRVSEAFSAVERVWNNVLSSNNKKI